MHRGWRREAEPNARGADRSVPAAQRQPRVPRVPVRTGTDVQGLQQPSRRQSCHHRCHHREPIQVQLRPRAEPAGVQGVRQRCPRHQVRALEQQADPHAVYQDPRGRCPVGHHRVQRQPRADQEPVGRSRLGGTRRRNFGRKSAQRRGVLVPVRRPSDFQSVVPHLDHHRFPVLCPRQRQADPQADPCESDDVGLRADRTDGNLPGNHSDRSVRAPAGERRAGTGLRRSPTSAASSVRRRLRAPTPDVGGLRKAVRAVSLCRLHRCGHRRRTRNPHRSAGTLDLRSQPLHRQTRFRTSCRTRACPSMVRQQPHSRAVVRHLATRRLCLLRGVDLVREFRWPVLEPTRDKRLSRARA